MAVEIYSGPKAQSIMNSPKHKSYIDARRRERFETGLPITIAVKYSMDVKYSTTDLDYKIRRYIDDLRKRNTILELAMREPTKTDTFCN